MHANKQLVNSKNMSLKGTYYAKSLHGWSIAVIGQNALQLWLDRCCGSVWTQSTLQWTKSPTPHFLIPLTKSVSLGLPFWFSCSVTSHCIGPGHGGWFTALHCYSFRPQRLYAVLHFLRDRAAVTSTMSHKQSRCSVFGCKTEHKSLHFLPTSELLRMLWVMHLKIYLNTCITPDTFVNVMSL